VLTCPFYYSSNTQNTKSTFEIFHSDLWIHIQIFTDSFAVYFGNSKAELSVTQEKFHSTTKTSTVWLRVTHQFLISFHSEFTPCASLHSTSIISQRRDLDLVGAVFFVTDSFGNYLPIGHTYVILFLIHMFHVQKQYTHHLFSLQCVMALS